MRLLVSQSQCREGPTDYAVLWSALPVITIYAGWKNKVEAVQSKPNLSRVFRINVFQLSFPKPSCPNPDTPADFVRAGSDTGITGVPTEHSLNPLTFQQAPQVHKPGFQTRCFPPHSGPVHATGPAAYLGSYMWPSSRSQKAPLMLRILQPPKCHVAGNFWNTDSPRPMRAMF